MDKTILLKYLAGAGLIGSLFALVVLGKMPVEAYTSLATGALGVIGGHAAASFGRGSAP